MIPPLIYQITSHLEAHRLDRHLWAMKLPPARSTRRALHEGKAPWWKTGNFGNGMTWVGP